MGLIKMVKVSIVIITYNHEEYIAEAIESCLIQDYPNLEIILADDASTDASESIIQTYCEKFPKKVIPVFNRQNLGIAGNWNSGIRAATGDYIVWLGGDDILLPGKIAEQVRYLDAHEELVGCYHDAEVFEWPSGKVLGNFFELYGKNGDGYVTKERFLHPKTQMLPSTMMVRKGALPANGADMRFKVLCDYIFDLETIINYGAYGRIDAVYTRYRKHSRSVGQNKENTHRMLEEKLMAMAVIQARYPDLSALVKKRSVYYLLEESIKALKSGDVIRSKGYCKSARVNGAFFGGWICDIFGGVIVKILYSDRAASYKRIARNFFA